MANVNESYVGVIKKGYSPYVNGDTGTWFEYDDDAKTYIDTGVKAEAREYIFTQEDKDSIAEAVYQNYNIESSINSQNAKISSIQSDIESIDSNLSSIENSVSTNTNKIASIEHVINLQDTSITNIKSDISTIKTTDSTQNTKIASLEANTTSQNTKIATLESNVNTKVASIDKTVSTQNTKIANLESSISAGLQVDDDPLEIYQLALQPTGTSGSSTNYSGINLHKYGNCTVLIYKGNVTVIDVGDDYEKTAGEGTTLTRFLKSKNITKVNNLIISHYHPDHVGEAGYGVRTLINNFTVEKAYLPHKNLDWTKFKPSGGSIQTLSVYVRKLISDKNITIIEPTVEPGGSGAVVYQFTTNLSCKFANVSTTYFDTYYAPYIWSNGELAQGYTSYNNFSMVTFIYFKNKELYFPGDIEYKAQLKMARFIGNPIVVLTEHHAINRKTYVGYAERLNPVITLVGGLGDDNATKPLKNLNNLGSAAKASNGIILDTKKVGQITVKIYNDRINYSTQTSVVDHSNRDFYNTPQTLAEGDDLNNITTDGIYFSYSMLLTAKLKNCPLGSYSGFRLEVKHTGADDSVVDQRIVAQNCKGHIEFNRTYRAGHGWTIWRVSYIPLPLKTLSSKFDETYFIKSSDILVSSVTLDGSGYSMVVNNAGNTLLSCALKLNGTLASGTAFLRFKNNLLPITGSEHCYAGSASVGNKCVPIYTTYYPTGNLTEVKVAAAVTGNNERFYFQMHMMPLSTADGACWNYYETDAV